MFQIVEAEKIATTLPKVQVVEKFTIFQNNANCLVQAFRYTAPPHFSIFGLQEPFFRGSQIHSHQVSPAISFFQFFFISNMIRRKPRIFCQAFLSQELLQMLNKKKVTHLPNFQEYLFLGIATIHHQKQ